MFFLKCLGGFGTICIGNFAIEVLFTNGENNRQLNNKVFLVVEYEDFAAGSRFLGH